MGELDDDLFYLDIVAEEGDEAELLDVIIRTLTHCKGECDNFSRYAGREIMRYKILLNEMKLKGKVCME